MLNVRKEEVTDEVGECKRTTPCECPLSLCALQVGPSVKESIAIVPLWVRCAMQDVVESYERSVAPGGVMRPVQLVRAPAQEVTEMSCPGNS